MGEPLDRLRTLRTGHLADAVGIADLQDRIRRRRRHHRLLAGGVLAAFVVVVLGSVALFAPNDRSAPVVTPTPDDTIADDGSARSQSDADAARDRVLRVISLAPTDVRVDARAELDTSEGRWVLSRATPDLEQVQAAGICSDAQGDPLWRVSEGCLAGYGEILLLDHEGHIERAYPMPGIAPTWIHATDRYIYAGRQGDGGFPNSSVVRIDRSDLTAEVAIFRIDDGSALYDPALPSWYEFGAVQHEQIEAILRPSADTGVPVTSWTNPDQEVDLIAIDALFATLPY